MVSALAISSAFFYGLSMIFTRIGLRSSNVLSGLLISLISSLIASLVIYFYCVTPHYFDILSLLYFTLAGIIGPCVGRVLLYIGINRVGSSIASQLHATKTLFSAITAVIILGERLTLSIVLGTIIMFIGIVIVSSENPGGQIKNKWSRKDLIFPIIAGACFGLAHVIRKIGLNVIQEPIIGVLVQNAAALSLFPLIVFVQKSQERLIWNDKRSWTIFSLSGISSVIGQLCLFYALDFGQVVIVSPLASTSPFFVILLAAVFLRNIERITWKIVLGAILIIVASTVLTFIPPE